MIYHPFRHLGLKALAVCIALALWFAVAGEQTVERSVRAPLELQNKPASLELIENPPAQIDVRVRGASSLLSHLQSGDIVAVVDLSSARAGRKIFHLTTQQVSAPFGIEVTQVTPGSVSLLFEPSAARTVPVVPVVEGEPAAGYTIGEITSAPPSVEVTGPESALRHLREATTEPVSVAGADHRVRETVNVGVADPSVRLSSPTSAVVTVQVSPASAERRFERVAVQARNLGRSRRAQLAPSAVAVRASGPRDVVEGLAAGAVTAYVDVAGLPAGRYNLLVRVESPQSAVVLQADPASVRVRIR